jgi:hypothetical protein
MKTRLGESQILSGRCGGQKNILLLPRIEPRPFSPYSVAIPTELSASLLMFGALTKDETQARRAEGGDICTMNRNL